MNGLMADQSKAIDHLLKWKVGALFMEAGTGKTRVAVELVNSVPNLDFLLWVGPYQTIHASDQETSVVYEVEKWGGFDCKNVLFVGVETIQSSDRTFLDILSRMEKSTNSFVVVDESLKIKNAEAKRTKRLLQIGEMAVNKLILNGTPLSRNLLDLWSQMEFLSPSILNMSLREFKNTFCKYTRITKRFGNYREFSKEFITGYENIDYLYSLIRHYVYECDLHLNISQNYQSIYYFIDDESIDKYNFLKEKYLSDETLLWKNNNIFIEMTQKMQHVYCTTEDKFSEVDRLFKSIDQKETIIFCKYIDSAEMCKKKYPLALVLSYQKESLGLNLQKYHHTIYFDKIWDLALRVQSGRRTFRTGQEYDCKYYDLTGNVGLESLIDKNIEKKVGMLEYFKGKTLDTLKSDL